MKKFIFFLQLPLLVVVVYIVYIYVYASLKKDKIYYFPQIEVYLKVYKPPFNKYGYVIFSKDSVFSFSKDIDFLKVYKSEISSVRIIFNPIENKNIYILDRWNNIKINQSNFIIKKIDRTDTIFFERKRVTNTNNQTLKSKYFEIFIEGYLQSLFYIDYDIADTPIKAESCSHSSLEWVLF